MKIRDVIDFPLRNFDSFFSLWVFSIFLTIAPGVLLWLITLGAFRYFHLMSLWCDFLLEKDLSRDR